jgi:ferric-dicitrate binding protein FerR (iron transport regulator)
MNLSDIRKKLEDYHAGRLDTAAKQQLQQALDALSGQELSELFPVDDFVNNEAQQLPESEVNAALERFRQNRKPVAKLAFIRHLGRYAAIFLLFLGSAFLLRKGILNWDRKPGEHFRSLRVEDGKHGSVTLADGSRITINGGSRLYYSNRTVYIEEGEAYFEIAKDDQHPFIVKSPHLNIQVLGTSFTVRNYKDERHASVSVNSGKIGLRGLVLSTGMELIADKEKGTFTKNEIDTSATTAWIRGELIFHDESLQKVLQVLQHKYAVSFDVKDTTLFKRKYTATFRNNTIENIMQQLKLISSFQYTISDNQIEIR